MAVWDSVQDASAIYNSGVPNDLTSLSPVGYWRSEQSYFTDNWLVNNSALSNYSTRSFNFDGVGDYIDCGDSDDFSFGDGSRDFPFSISAWIKMDDVTNSSILSKTNISPSHYEYSAHFNSEQIYFGVYSQNSNADYLFVNYATNLTSYEGIWIHLAFTYDGSSNINGLKIYLNGQRVDDTQFTSGTYVSMNNTTAPLKIGRSFNNRFLNGFMDEVSIFDVELTDSNVTDIYNSGEPARIEGAIAHWRMGEDATFNTNWNVPDQVGSNTGTSVNMTIADLEGNAPNYTGGGLSVNMTIEDRVGDAPNSTSNALSYNMTESDRETDVPS